MSRDWKPGEQALITTPDGKVRLATFDAVPNTAGQWLTGGMSFWVSRVDYAQPVAVIAYEDREQVERLNQIRAHLPGFGVERTQEALREFADPTRTDSDNDYDPELAERIIKALREHARRKGVPASELLR